VAPSGVVGLVSPGCALVNGPDLRGRVGAAPLPSPFRHPWPSRRSRPHPLPTAPTAVATAPDHRRRAPHVHSHRRAHRLLPPVLFVAHTGTAPHGCCGGCRWLIYDDFDVAVVLRYRAGLRIRRALLTVRRRVEKLPLGGSRPGRRPNWDRIFDLGAHSIMRDYFGVGGELPVYSERDFEKRNRMPRAIFKRLYTAVRNEPWWRRSINATGRLQSYPIQKLLAALRVLGSWEPYDRPDEYCRLSPSTIAEATRRLTKLTVDK